MQHTYYYKGFYLVNKKITYSVIGIIFLLGSAFRLIGLQIKPPHFDEGINWFFTQNVLKSGFYIYDPHNYHGPLHFYLLALTEILFSSEVWSYRFVTACFSIMSLILVFLSKSYLGRTAFLTAFFFAISPALIFYSRYAIHETELVFFLILSFYGLLKMAHQHYQKGFCLFLIGCTGCLLTKETFIIHLAAMVFAFISLGFLQNTFVLHVWKNMKNLNKQFVLITSATLLFVLFAFYTGFFQNLSGTKNFFYSIYVLDYR